MINWELLRNPLNWVAVAVIIYFWAWVARAILGSTANTGVSP